MPEITTADLKFFESEEMSNADEGGGRMTSREIVSGTENAFHEDLTPVDFAAGDVSIAKSYAAVASPNTEKFLDAGVIIFKPPANPNVSELMFSTGSFYDRRVDMAERLQQIISRGAEYQGYLWGTHLEGQRSVTLWQREEAPIPAVNTRLDIAGPTENQFVWVTDVTEALITRQEFSGETLRTYLVRQVICEISEKLRHDFVGSQPSRDDPRTLTTRVYETRYNPESVALFGVKPLAEDALIGESQIRVESIFDQLVPTSLLEVPIADQQPGGGTATYARANDGTIAQTTNAAVIAPDADWHLGGPVFPGSLSIAVSGATITEVGGQMLLADLPIGSIDNATGRIAWSENCPNYGGASKTATFVPAARSVQLADTAAVQVALENRGYVWTLTLAPIPAPGSLSIAYRANDQWYVLRDRGDGVLQGADSQYGTATLDFTTGTSILTTGALPDVDSPILYAWAQPATYAARGGEAVAPAKIRGQTAKPGVAPGSFSIGWDGNLLSDDGQGNLTGSGGAGTVKYSTGEWEIEPTVLPAVATEFAINYDQGAVVTETFAPSLSGGNVTVTTAQVPRAGSIEVDWDLLVADDLSTEPTTYSARDDGAGALVIQGNTNGTINYASRTITFPPNVSLIWPQPVYDKRQIGGLPPNACLGGCTYSPPEYAYFFSHWSNASTPGQFPGGGEVRVTYRQAGGDTAQSETYVLNQLEFDLTLGHAQQIVRGSARFTLAALEYVDLVGVLYSGIDPATGVGTVSGSLDPSTGVARLSTWPEAATNSANLRALATELTGRRGIDRVKFRVDPTPLKPGSLQLRGSDLEGNAFDILVDLTGYYQDATATVIVDDAQGVVQARFGEWRTVASLTTEELAADWYDPGSVVNMSGTDYIWQPILIDPNTLIFNAVANTYQPPDSEILRIDAARLPADGRALIYAPQRLVVIHHTDILEVASLSPSQVVDLGRERLWRLEVRDSNGALVTADQYNLDRATGIATMTASADLAGFTAPFFFAHTIADLVPIRYTDIAGYLDLTKQLTFDFPAGATLVSSVLYIGDMQARVVNLFSQASWTDVWSDDRIGVSPDAQFDSINFPIEISNLGAYPDRYRIDFTGTTNYRVIGEQLGVLGNGNTGTDLTLTNPLTGHPFLTIRKEAFSGGGWEYGNQVRFEIVAAAWPIGLIRATQPSAPTEVPDSIELLFLGAVNA